MPMFYAGYVVDFFSDGRVLIGIFDSPGKAEDACEIVVRQAIIAHKDNCPDGRFCHYWEEMRLNEFSLDGIDSFVY